MNNKLGIQVVTTRFMQLQFWPINKLLIILFAVPLFLHWSLDRGFWFYQTLTPYCIRDVIFFSASKLIRKSKTSSTITNNTKDTDTEYFLRLIKQMSLTKWLYEEVGLATTSTNLSQNMFFLGSYKDASLQPIYFHDIYITNNRRLGKNQKLSPYLWDAEGGQLCPVWLFWNLECGYNYIPSSDLMTAAQRCNVRCIIFERRTWYHWSEGILATQKLTC